MVPMENRASCQIQSPPPTLEHRWVDVRRDPPPSKLGSLLRIQLEHAPVLQICTHGDDGRREIWILGSQFFLDFILDFFGRYMHADHVSLGIYRCLLSSIFLGTWMHITFSFALDRFLCNLSQIPVLKIPFCGNVYVCSASSCFCESENSCMFMYVHQVPVWLMCSSSYCFSRNEDSSASLASLSLGATALPLSISSSNSSNRSLPPQHGLRSDLEPEDASSSETSLKCRKMSQAVNSRCYRFMKVRFWDVQRYLARIDFLVSL